MAVLTSISNFAPIPIFNQRWPRDCPAGIAFDMDFNGIDEYEINLLQSIQQGYIEGVQACYYDNISNLSRVTMEALGTGFRTQFAPQWFGFRTLLLPEKPQMKFTTTGGTGIFRVIMTNTPLMPMDQLGA